MSTHVVFDLGQTVVNGNKGINESLRMFATSIGKQWQDNDFTEIESLRECVKEVLITILDQSDRNAAKIAKEVFGNMLGGEFEMMPGVEKLLRHLHDHNIPMAIASNLKMNEVNLGVNGTVGLDKAWFRHWVAGGDDPEVQNNKPAPDIYWVTARSFNPHPKSMNSCVVFEDSIRGINGAVESGMKTVLINAIPVHELGAIANKITVIVDSLENFRPESVGLPPYQ